MAVNVTAFSVLGVFKAGITWWNLERKKKQTGKKLLVKWTK